MAFSGNSVRQQNEALASELMQQAVGDVGQVVEPIAQIRIRSGAAAWRGRRSGRARPRPRRSGRWNSPPHAAGVATRDRGRSFWKASSTSRCSPPTPSSLRSIRSSTEARMAPIAVSSRMSSEETSSATILETVTRG